MTIKKDAPKVRVDQGTAYRNPSSAVFALHAELDRLQQDLSQTTAKLNEVPNPNIDRGKIFSVIRMIIPIIVGVLIIVNLLYLFRMVTDLHMLVLSAICSFYIGSSVVFYLRERKLPLTSRQSPIQSRIIRSELTYAVILLTYLAFTIVSRLSLPNFELGTFLPLLALWVCSLGMVNWHRLLHAKKGLENNQKRTALEKDIAAVQAELKALGQDLPVRVGVTADEADEAERDQAPATLATGKKP